jgi:hypothetical protein
MQNYSFPPGNNNENQFTKSLERLIRCIPEVGQALVDLLLLNSGRGHDRFVKCSAQPKLLGNVHPDFMLSCEGCDILIEHKLEGNLGERQLERYLQLAHKQSRPTLLALISNQPIRGKGREADFWGRGVLLLSSLVFATPLLSAFQPPLR